METPATDPTPLWPLAVYAGAAVILVGALLLLSYILGERHRSRAAQRPYESGVAVVGDARLRLSAKFYLVAVFFVVFDLEAVYIFAWAIAFRETGWPGFLEASLFIGVLLLALGYLWRLGALDWGPATRQGGATTRVETTE